MARTLRGQRVNHTFYFLVGGILGLIILITIAVNVFGNKKNNDNNIQIGESNSQSIDAEEANSPLGKKVEEMSENSETSDEFQVEVKNEDSVEIDEKLTEAKVDESKKEVQVNKVDEIKEEKSAIVETKKEETNNNNETKNEQVTEETTEEAKDPTFKMPVEGEIIKHYGKEKLIYSNTLKEWTTHLGIDIKADKTTVVKASADGTVKSIKNDPRYGLTVVLEHNNGFTSVYANLLTAEFVVVGEKVKAGQTLGTVGNSATFEILDEPHLHFEIIKEGNSIDPEMYIK